jgi:hypothetical protein
MSRNPIARQVTHIRPKVKPGKRAGAPEPDHEHCEGCGRAITCNRSGNDEQILCIKCVGLYAFVADHTVD